MIRPRICFVLPSLNGGGAERAAVSIANALDADRFDVELCLFRREGAYLGEVAPHVAVRQVGDGGRFGRIRGLRGFFAARRPAVVMSFLSYLSVFAAARWANAGIKFVINQQTPVTAFLEDRDFRWREPLRRAVFERGVRAVYARADLVVATSEGVRQDLVTRFGVPQSRVEVVHNPVDLGGIARLAREPIESGLAGPDDRIVVAAGRLAEVKNFPLLISAVGLLASRMPIRLWILGQGDQQETLTHRVAECGLAGRVAWLGFQKNPWRYMARAHAFALTSRYEGFGNVLIEAMACGVPVVATASSGTRAIVQHGVTGLLVEAHEPQAVAAALGDILVHPARAQALVANARRALAPFDLATIADRYAALFGHLATQS